MESTRSVVCYQADEHARPGVMPYATSSQLHTATSCGFHAALRADWDAWTRKEPTMAKNLLLEYSEELATKCELLCRSMNGNSNTVFQLRKSSSSVFANITEAQYPQSLADMLSKFKIARKECAETESWLKLLYNTKVIDEETFKSYRNLCGRIQRMLTSSCITIEKKIDSK